MAARAAPGSAAAPVAGARATTTTTTTARTASRRILFSPYPSRVPVSAPSSFDVRSFLARDAERRPHLSAPRPRSMSPGYASMHADLEDSLRRTSGARPPLPRSTPPCASREASTPKRSQLVRRTPSPRSSPQPPPSQPHAAQAAMDVDDDGLDADTRLAMELMQQEQDDFVRRILEEQQRALQQMRATGEAETWAVEDAEDMDYDELLDLGARLGDVRHERWREVSEGVAASLRACAMHAMTVAERQRYRDDTCLVCHCAMEAEDAVKLMPHCSHSFHEDCVDVWIRDNNSCVTCKEPIVKDGA